jgi:hypothetical protein
MLDAKRPLPGTWAAWEVLDAIVHGSGSVPGADDAATRALLGGGTSLVVRSPQPPDSRWPWSQRGDWWILRHNPLGPGTLASESAYLPVRGWPSHPGASSALQIIGFGILMMVGALTAWRERNRFFRWSGVLAVSLALIGIVLGWPKRGPAQYEVEGTVAFFNDGLLQHDYWEYRSPGKTDGVVSCECLLDTRQPRERWARVATRPVLAFPEQAIPQQLTLEVDVAGEPQKWTARLGPGEKLAFVTRLVDPYPGKGYSPYSTTIDSPLAPLVREAYLVPGVYLTGQGYPRTDKEYAFAEVFLERGH